MNELQFANQPELKDSVMIAAWGGWSDAGSAATQALAVIGEQIKAERLATIDGERFFQFTHTRPQLVQQGPNRVIEWPMGRFFYRRARTARERDLVLFYGYEPQLRWRAYCEFFKQVAGACDTQLLVSVGAYLDAVPHTVQPPVHITSNSKNLRQVSQKLDFPNSNYEGPISIASVIADDFLQSEIPCVSLWGSSPNYLDVDHNPDLTAALIAGLNPFLPKPIDTSELVKQGKLFRQEAQKRVDSVKDLNKYVDMLEENFKINADDKLVSDVEQFLKKRRQPNEDV